MFKKGQHTVKSRLERSGEKYIFVEAQGSVVTISGFRQEGSGYSYKDLTVDIDGRIVKKTEDLREISHLVLKHFTRLGLRS